MAEFYDFGISILRLSSEIVGKTTDVKFIDSGYDNSVYVVSGSEDHPITLEDIIKTLKEMRKFYDDKDYLVGCRFDYITNPRENEYIFIFDAMCAAQSRTLLY